MAEGDGHAYNEFKFQLLNGAYNLAAAQDTVKVMLVTAHSLDIDGDTQYSDPQTEEESGTGYTAGGVTVASKVTSKDNTNDRGKFTCGNPAWTGLDVGTPNYAIMYSVTASNLLMIAWEITTASNGGNYTLNVHADGICYIG